MVDVDFRVVDEEGGERIDKVVARKFPELGRRGAAELFGKGRVLVNGRAAKKGDRARIGATVVVRLEGQEVDAEPGEPLDVVFEADLVVVVRKPAGQATAPLRFGEIGTLANSVLGHYPETKGVGYRAREPGLLHRLDTQTSGLIVVARSGAAFLRLREALSGGRIEKRYLALVGAGKLSGSGVVREYLAPDPRNARRVQVVPPTFAGARPASTAYRALRSAPSAVLVEVSVSHAYRHQVRAHLAWLGAPILGDALYGGAAVPALGDRHALHASYVAWAGDDVVPAFAVTDPLPAELEALLSD